MNRLLFLAAATIVASTAWSATYNFTSGNYTSIMNFSSCTVGPCANFTTSMKITGSFTVASPLAANLPGQEITSQVTAYSFSDGITTYTNTNPNARIYWFLVYTDASGQIVGTIRALEVWQSGSSPHHVDDRWATVGIGTQTFAENNAHCFAVGTGPAGIPDTCIGGGGDVATSAAPPPRQERGPWRPPYKSPPSANGAASS